MGNLLTSNRMYHSKGDVGRLYVSRRYSGRGMIQMEVTFKITITISTPYDWMLQLDHVNTRQRLRSLCLKAETEGFIMIAQDQSPFTKNY